MEVVTLLTQFITDLIHYTIWPATVLVVVLIFYAPISRLIERLKRAKWGEGALEFGDIPPEIKKTIQSPDSILAVTEENCSYVAYVRLLVVLAATAGAVAQMDAPSKFQLPVHILDGVIRKLDKEKLMSEWLRPLKAIKVPLDARLAE